MNRHKIKLKIFNVCDINRLNGISSIRHCRRKDEWTWKSATETAKWDWVKREFLKNEKKISELAILKQLNIQVTGVSKVHEGQKKVSENIMAIMMIVCIFNVIQFKQDFPFTKEFMSSKIVTDYEKYRKLLILRTNSIIF